MFAQIVPAKRLGGLAEEFDAAERAAAQRVDVSGPAALRTGERVAHVR